MATWWNEPWIFKNQNPAPYKIGIHMQSFQFPPSHIRLFESILAHCSTQHASWLVKCSFQVWLKHSENARKLITNTGNVDLLSAWLKPSPMPVFAYFSTMVSVFSVFNLWQSCFLFPHLSLCRLLVVLQVSDWHFTAMSLLHLWELVQRMYLSHLLKSCAYWNSTAPEALSIYRR